MRQPAWSRCGCWKGVSSSKAPQRSAGWGIALRRLCDALIMSLSGHHRRRFCGVELGRKQVSEVDERDHRVLDRHETRQELDLRVARGAWNRLDLRGIERNDVE